MANKLKIYACSGIGDAAPKSSRMFNYWTDNTNTLTNTQAVNNMLAKINLLLSEIENMRLNDGEVLDRLDQIDMLVVCLDAAQNYANHYSRLEKAGRVIGTMYAQKQFVCDSLNNDERDKHLDELISWFEDAMQSDGQFADQFPNWWNENVVKLNKVGLDAAQRAAVQDALASSNISGIGDLDWHDNKELSEYLGNAGTYFLYTYFTNAQISALPKENGKIFVSKKQYQLKIYNYCKSLFVGIYGTESAMKDIIRAGIVQKFGVQPEDVCRDIVSGRRKIEDIGQIATSIIVAIIGAVASIIIGLIKAVCQAVAQSKASQYAAIDQAAIEAGCPNESDYDGLYEKLSSPSKSGVSVILLAAVAVGLLIFGRN